MNKFQKSQSEKIFSCYIEKSKSVGEGSKGGAVIGHTKSGKPIYEGHYQHKVGQGHFTDSLPPTRGNDIGKVESGKQAVLRISKDFPDGKHGVSISTDNGEKRYLIDKDSKKGVNEIHGVDKKTYGKATGTDSYSADGREERTLVRQ